MMLAPLADRGGSNLNYKIVSAMSYLNSFWIKYGRMAAKTTKIHVFLLNLSSLSSTF